jgi:hypothetical protein
MGLHVMFVVGVVRQQHGDHKGESSGKRVEGSAPQRDRFASSSLRLGVTSLRLLDLSQWLSNLVILPTKELEWILIADPSEGTSSTLFGM